MKAQLQRAVRGTEVPVYLESSVRARIRSSRRVPGWTQRLAPAALALAICGSGYLAYELGHLRWSVASQDAYIASLSARLGGLMTVGLRDHIHCAVFRKYPKEAPSLKSLRADMGPKYSPLIDVVQAKMPEDFRMVMAHQCRYQGRDFIHLAIRSHRKLLSVLVASRRDGESFAAQRVVPALQQEGITLFKESIQHFEISAFETRDFLVYIVSDLPEQGHTQVAVSLAAPVREFLARLEA